MCLSFTDHVRTFGGDCDPEARVLPRLEKLLKQRMRRRGLLFLPPSFLGYDVPNWEALGAFDDIVVDCYLFAIVRRIEGLRNQLRVRPNIEGLITRNVDNFLFDRQSRRDAIGYAVFANLEAAIADLAVAGQANVDTLDERRLRSDSIVRLGSGAASSAPCDPKRLEEAVLESPRFSEALASLVAASDEGREWMIELARQMAAADIRCFRVSDLVAAIATRARGDWNARHAAPAAELGYEDDDESFRLVRLVWPDESLDTTDLFETLKRVVPERIAQERQMRVRKGLSALFEEWIRTIEEEGLSRPNQAELVRRLTMSAKTLSDYLQRLRGILHEVLPEKPDE